MKEILNDESFSLIAPIHKGWSNDKKYYVETKNGKKLLLRVSDISEYEVKKQEFEQIKLISAVGINMSMPIAFGVCNGGKSVYQLLTWCEGEEAKEALLSLAEAEQYEYGLKAASILKQMETINYKSPSLEWAKKYQERVEHYIELYRKCGCAFKDDELIISYLLDKQYCIGERPMALLHEDFQTDNMVISPGGELAVIDFQLCGVVDPYLVMTGAGVSAMYSIPFAIGQIDGYFGNTVPEDFWEKYAYYMLAEMLYAFTVGVRIAEERQTTLHMFDDEVDRIKHHGSYIPTWYLKKHNDDKYLFNQKGSI